MILKNKAKIRADLNEGYYRPSLLHLDISAEAKILYLYVSNTVDGDSISNKELLKFLDCEVKKLHRSEKELIDIGLLEIKRKSVNGKYFYHITVFDLEN